MNKTYTVGEITRYLKDLITNDIFLSSVYISGEISNLKLHSSSHIYFTLKDENCSIKAVMFSNYTRALRFIPEDGMKVIVYGSVTVYEKAGVYQLMVSNMVPEGLGELYLAFEQLKDKLRLKGYFTRDKKPVPKYPRFVAVITSKTGAALKDFLNVAQRRARGIPITVYNSLVQGPDASRQIAARIEQINRRNEADVIVIARGGGSIEELWPFNEEITADAIYNSKIPVVTGIGHESDFTIADMTADLRAPTPSAAAEIVFPDMFAVSNNIAGMFEKAMMIINARIVRYLGELDRLLGRHVFAKPDMLFDKYKQELDQFDEQIKDLIQTKLKFKKQELLNKVEIIEKVNPYSILQKGYSFTTTKDGTRISSIKDIETDMDVIVRYHDGRYSAKVKDVITNE
jgi:exodeoxyribonuclease VII large subunit